MQKNGNGNRRGRNNIRLAILLGVMALGIYAGYILIYYF